MADQNRGEEAGEPVVLAKLPVNGASEIDGLRLVETPDATILLCSRQESRSPPVGVNDHSMEISAVSVKAPSVATVVAVIPRLLPPAPRWDARARGPGYELLYERAGGALYAVLARDPSGQVSALSAAYATESFFHPRFIRGEDLAGPAAGALAGTARPAGERAAATHPGTGRCRQLPGVRCAPGACGHRRPMRWVLRVQCARPGRRGRSQGVRAFGLVLVGARTLNLPMFRLASSPEMLLVHDRVMRALWDHAPERGWGFSPVEIPVRTQTPD